MIESKIFLAILEILCDETVVVRAGKKMGTMSHKVLFSAVVC